MDAKHRHSTTNRTGRTPEARTIFSDNSRRRPELSVVGNSIGNLKATAFVERLSYADKEGSVRVQYSGSKCESHQKAKATDIVREQKLRLRLPFSQCHGSAAFISVDAYMERFKGDVGIPRPKFGFVKKLDPATLRGRKVIHEGHILEFCRTRNGSMIRIGRGAFGLVYMVNSKHGVFGLSIYCLQ